MITTLSGKNSFALNKELNGIIENARSSVGDMGIERLNAQETEIDVLFQSVQSLPFLTAKKLVVIDEVQSNDDLLERIEELIDRTPETVDVVLVGPVFDKRKSAYGVLKKKTNLIEFSDLSLSEFPRWVVEYAESLEAKISSNDAKYLVDRVGTNQLLICRELEKLSLFSADINKESIDKLTGRSAQSTIFTLLDAAFAGDSKKALGLYREQREQRVDPHYIIAMLTWQLHSLAQAVFAEPQTESSLVSAGVSPYSARKSLSLAGSINRSNLRKMVKELCEVDERIKTDTNPDAALELFLLSL